MELASINHPIDKQKNYNFDVNIYELPYWKVKKILFIIYVKVFIKMKRVTLLKSNKSFLITRWNLEVTASALVKPNMNNTKINIYKIVLQEVCEKFNGTEQYITERIKELCNKKNYQQKRYWIYNDYNF